MQKTTRTMMAKFSGPCAGCNTRIQAGDLIIWDPTASKKRAKHRDCAAVAAKLAALSAEVARASAAKAVAEDRTEEELGPMPHVCPNCNGTGLRTKSVNVSNTLDYRDFREFPYQCGQDIETRWAGGAEGWPQLMVRGTDQVAAIQPNSDCVRIYGAHRAWEKRRVEILRSLETQCTSKAH